MIKNPVLIASDFLDAINKPRHAYEFINKIMQ